MTTQEVGRLITVVPAAGRKCGGAGKSSAWRAACAVFLLCVATAIAAPAQTQTFQTLIDFNFYNGALPYLMSLVQGTDGNLYGTASYGGACDAGTVFRITPAGILTTLHNFCPLHPYPPGPGYYPEASLVLGRDGNFYGTTRYSDINSTDTPGTFFKINPGAKRLTTLHDFNDDGSEGLNPEGAVVQASDGNFYGTAVGGGAYGGGTVFTITPGGVLTKLYDFDFVSGGGQNPAGGLVQASDGNFYGTTVWGGTYDLGTVFKITPEGVLTTLYSFCTQSGCADGAQPWGTLIQGSDGNLYGTTLAGGSINTCPPADGTPGCGTAFAITLAGQLTTLYSFCFEAGCADGGQPFAGLILATDGNFYGTTTVGGANGDGTIFQMTTSGPPPTEHSFHTEHNFDGTDGQSPAGALLQDTNGTFYGTTYSGGPYNAGTVFSLSMGFGPFVTLVPSSGSVRQAQAVGILGQGFTGTTEVSFNGTQAASFGVVSDTYLTAAIPVGATTGPVTVTTPSGTLTSNASFRVTPQLSRFSPTSGPVGTAVTITGMSLTQTSSVTFGGVAATTFTVDSDTQVTATVPAGAESGSIAITTVGGSAVSTTDFTVIP